MKSIPAARWLRDRRDLEERRTSGIQEQNFLNAFRRVRLTTSCMAIPNEESPIMKERRRLVQPNVEMP